MKTIYTIGHSNGSSEHLLSLLDQHGITAVADVRSRPYSHFSPEFKREALASALKNSGREYFFLGHELGARSEDRACYRDGRAQYVLIAQTPLFKRGIECLLAKMENFQVAILCAEKEPLSCHRSILIARSLHEKSVSVRHVHRGWKPGRSRRLIAPPFGGAWHSGEPSFPHKRRVGGDGVREASGTN